MHRFFLVMFCAVAVSCEPAPPSAPAEIHVTFETGLGDIVLAVDSVHAPVTAANFLRYVNTGLYDGGSFFRSVRADNQPNDSIRIEVIQGGANQERSDGFFAPIPLETTAQTGLSHLEGTLSMARSGPDTATHSFFICVADEPELDFGGLRQPDGQGFAAFGRVVQGMDVVRAIQAGQVQGQSLLNPVVITRASRTDRP